MSPRTIALSCETSDALDPEGHLIELGAMSVPSHPGCPPAPRRRAPRSVPGAARVGHFAGDDREVRLAQARDHVAEYRSQRAGGRGGGRPRA